MREVFSSTDDFVKSLKGSGVHRATPILREAEGSGLGAGQSRPFGHAALNTIAGCYAFWKRLLNCPVSSPGP